MVLLVCLSPTPHITSINVGIQRCPPHTVSFFTSSAEQVEEMVVDGRHIPLHLNVSTSFFGMFALRTVDGKDWLFSHDNYTNASIHDLDGG